MSRIPQTTEAQTWDRVYSPRSALAQPFTLFREMTGSLLASRELAWRLFVRNTSAAYRRTALGYVWAFLPPLFTTVTFLFLQHQKVLSLDTGSIPYVVFVLAGTMLWQTFYEALNAPLKLAGQSKVMLAKINFPREALIVAGILEVCFNFLIRMVLLVPVLIAYGFYPGLGWLAALGSLLALVMTGTVIGVLMLPIGILYEDVEKGLPLIAGVWMFLTPVVYAPPTEGPARWLMILNPVSPLLAQTRDWLTGGPSAHLGLSLIVATLFTLLSLLGWLLYRISLPHIIARLPS